MNASSAAPESGVIQQIVRAIYDAIENGVYVPGQRLIEADLTRDLQVSRPSLREAFQRLSAEGVLDILPNRGVMVRRFDADDITQIQQIRNVLEPLAAEGAARCIDQAGNRAQFERVAAPWMGAPPVDDIETFLRENRRLHRTIVELSGNPHMVPIMERLNVLLLCAHFRYTFPREQRVASSAKHQAIAQAILAGDAPLARRLMKQHMAHSESQMQQYLARNGPRPKHLPMLQAVRLR